MKSWLENHNAKRMETYALMPHDLREHYGIEQTVLAGGYGYRQVMELIQNGADAILEFHQNCALSNGGERDDLIHVLLRDSRLYVANTGAPLSREGVEALLSSHSSPKRGNQIGRFGLGFKSLLRLGGIIDIFTKMAGAIRFDPERCRRELRGKFAIPDVPGLRLAWPLADSEHAADSVAEHFPWAETLVRVDICQEEFLEHLRTEIAAFPPEFLLFLPVPARLILDDGVTQAKELRVEPTGTESLLFAGEDQVRWHIISSEVSITDERAVTDATHIHARQTVPVAWAMPLDSKREEAGRFWAFFPTHTPLYLPGILNAPWKLNSDRNAIISGEWNTALMREAAKLIAAALPRLSTNTDPGRPLDAFPRQLERKEEDAAPLVEALWTALEEAEVVPDAAGDLRLARDLYRHPLSNAEIARQWQALAGKEEMKRMVHPSSLERQRSSRLNALAERLKPQDALPYLASRSATSWFAAVASTESEKAVEVLKLAEAYERDSKAIEWSWLRPQLSIIPTESGKLVTAGKAVFAPGETHVPVGRHLVSRQLSENEEARRILLEVMKVSPIDATVWETALRESLESNLKAPPTAQDAGWLEFWAQLRTAPELARNHFVTEHRLRIRIRRIDGSWVAASAVLFPGTLIGADDATASRKFLVDTNLHGDDTHLLRTIGVRECPEGNVQCKKFDELWEWLYTCRHGYKEKHKNSASWDYLGPIDLIMPAGWEFLPQLIGNSNARLTERFLARVSRGEFGDTVLFGHCTVSNYPKIDVTHPLLWFLLKHGSVAVGGRTVSLASIAARLKEPSLKMIPQWDQIEGALNKLKGAVPGGGTTKAEICNFWLALVKELAIPRFLADDSLRALWSGAANDNVVPEMLGTEQGQIPLSQVYVTGSADLAQRARAEGYLVVALDDHALKLWLESGARDLAELMSPQFVETTGPAGLLVSTVPEIVEVLREKEKTAARCQPVSGLELIIAGTGYPAPCLVWDNILLFDAGQMASLSREDRLRYLLNEISIAGWLENEPEEALRILGGTQMDALRAMVAEGSTLPERLYRAVGMHDEPLREALGALADMDFLKECNGLKLAELTLAQLGPATLNTLKNTLTAEGLNPPGRWNTAEARAFVASIGFPESFAASADVRRESEEIITGPIYLPSLHDFQEEVLDGIKALISVGRTRRRAVVSLPTGGGKTRVTVEAAVRLVLRPEGDCRSIIWVAQTDELCEQAVQAFRQVWVNIGAEKTDLRIVRMWGGNPTPAIQELDKPVVVVASIQTLNNRMGTDGLSWLQKPGLVVVDECHHAITPSYTNLLRWLDAEAPKPGEAAKGEPPILGLSATPFRTDDLESQRLARRFDNLWLPSNQEELHLRLRTMGVLAEIDADALESGVGLLPEEIEQLSKLSERWEGIEFENILEAINQRLAGSKQRNERLVEHIKKRKERSILLFANSVSHADEMSARLNLQGIPAASVSGYTPAAARRYFLERFQKGEIRVLCNHSVLSTGFDAPKTDMVLISRAIFSPVRYMQIVGRGLRGEKNGGTPRCRIVTVIDNLGRFQDRHPYHYCQKYFSQ
jgi:superfamily II DNA or RNA helicase